MSNAQLARALGHKYVEGDGRTSKRGATAQNGALMAGRVGKNVSAVNLQQDPDGRRCIPFYLETSSAN